MLLDNQLDSDSFVVVTGVLNAASVLLLICSLSRILALMNLEIYYIYWRFLLLAVEKIIKHMECNCVSKG